MPYPKRRNGDEYYGTEPFVVDDEGRERYARDRHGNEVYPKRKRNLFARNARFEEYYARDQAGNEWYPCFQGQSILIPGRLARYADGKQRYPTDAKGNEYYLQTEGKPYLLQQENGEPYLAKTRKGIPMIPWNEMRVTDDRPYMYTKDVLGNCVYIHETDLPQSLKVICNCLCQCVALCPSLLRALIA